MGMLNIAFHSRWDVLSLYDKTSLYWTSTTGPIPGVSKTAMY